ncbi:MAG: Phage protein [uncultured Clostridium sp.]
MKLKELLEYISTYNKVRIRNIDNGEEFFPPYAELNRYGEYYVTEINAESSCVITISIKGEE